MRFPCLIYQLLRGSRGGKWLKEYRCGDAERLSQVVAVTDAAGSQRWHNPRLDVLMRCVAAVLLLFVPALGGGCNREPAAVAKRVIRLVNDRTLSELLALELNRNLPDLEIHLVEYSSVGSYLTIDAVERGEADFGFALADVAYFSYGAFEVRPESGRSPIRGLASLQITPVHLLTRPGVTIRSVSELQGLRVSTGAEVSQLARLTDLIFRAYGVESESLLRGSPAPNTAASLANGTIDAAFVIGYYPSAQAQAATTAGAHLVPIDGPAAERMQHDYPFIHAVRIPPGTYPGQHGAVNTLGVHRLLICRSDLDEHVAHDLTKQLLAALPRLASTLRTSLRLMDLDQASAMPIPLHRGAAQYYRERELSR